MTDLIKPFTLGGITFTPEVETDDTNINASLGDTPKRLLKAGIKSQPGSQISLGDYDLGIDIALGLLAENLGKDRPMTLFGTDQAIQPPSGETFLQMSLNAALAAGLDIPDAVSGPAKVTFKGKLDSAFAYKAIRAFPTSTKLTKAAVNLQKDLVWPLSPNGSEIPAATGAAMSGRLNLDLGLDISFGYDFSFAKSIFDMLPVKGQVKAFFNAGLGLTLLENMDLVVGRFATSNPDWIRVRMARTHERSLTLSATLEIQATYDVGSGLVKLLEKVLEEEPFVRARQLLDRMVDLQGDLDQFTNMSPDQIKAELAQRLGDRLFNELDQLIDLSNLEQLPELRKFTEKASEIVTAYNDLDPMVRSLWGELLGRTDLGPSSKLYKAIAKLAAIDPNQIDIGDLLGPDYEPYLDLLEMLMGETIESLVLQGNEAFRRIITKAQALAAQAKEFIDDFPSDILNRVNAFAEKHGILGFINFLSQHASNPQQVVDYIRGEGRRIAEKLLLKGIDRIRDKDIQKLLSFVEKVSAAIGKADSFEDELKGKLEELKGELGFKLGLELQRTTQKSQILDIECDPQACKNALKSLKSLSLAKFLKALPSMDSERRQAKPLPYLIRDSVMTSKKLKTSAMNVFLNLLFGSGARTRTLEWSVAVNQEGNQFQRTGTYSGGLARSFNEHASEWMAAVSLTFAGISDQASPLLGGYNQLTSGLTVEMSRIDSSANADEKRALIEQMADFGAVPSDSFDWLNQAKLTLSLRLELPQAWVTASLQHTSPWDIDFINAAQGWYGQSIAPSKRLEKHGKAMAVIVGSDSYLEFWDGIKTIRDFLDRRTMFQIKSHGSLNGDYKVRVNPLPSIAALAASHTWAKNPLVDMTAAVHAALAAKNHEQALEAVRESQRGFHNATPRGASWADPVFLAWLILARVWRVNRAALDSVKGIMTIKQETNAGKVTWDHAKITRIEAQRLDGLFKTTLAEYEEQDL